MAKKIIIINFKCYKEATGKNAEKLIKDFEVIAKKFPEIKIAVAVQPADIYRISKLTKKIEIYAQHMDSISPGPFTGHISALSIKESGATGVILNHSEKNIPINEIEEATKKAKELGLKIVICAKNDKVGSKLSKISPDYIAVEPPELIGGKISVSKANPSLVKKSVEKIIGKTKNLGLIVGAGVHNQEDVKIAVKLGADGILIASGIVLAKNPTNVLEDLCKGFK